MTQIAACRLRCMERHTAAYGLRCARLSGSVPSVSAMARSRRPGGLPGWAAPGNTFHRSAPDLTVGVEDRAPLLDRHLACPEAGRPVVALQLALARDPQVLHPVRHPVGRHEVAARPHLHGNDGDVVSDTAATTGDGQLLDMAELEPADHRVHDVAGEGRRLQVRHRLTPLVCTVRREWGRAAGGRQGRRSRGDRQRH